MRKNNIGDYFAAPLTAGLIFLCVALLKGFVPFGNVYPDYFDMGQSSLTLYYHIFDVLHAEKSMFLDVYSGLGQNMTITFTPFMFFFYLIPREFLRESMTFYILLRIMFCAFSMKFLQKETSPSTPKFYTSAFSIIYALSGYVLSYYVFDLWIDVAALFPLLLLGLARLLKSGKCRLYTAMLTITLCTSYYLGAITLLAILICSGVYILMFTSAHERGKICLDLGVWTFGAIALSAPCILPHIAQVATSMRFSMSVIRAANITDKLRLLMPCTLPLLFIVSAAFAKPNNVRQKTARFSLIIIFALCVQIFVEPIALAWHGGSYITSPLRYFFVPIAFICAAAAHFLPNGTDCRRTAHGAVLGVVFSIALIFCYSTLSSPAATRFFPTAMCGVFLLLYVLFYRKNALIACVLTAEICFCAYVLVGMPPYKGATVEQNGSFITVTQNIADELQMAPSAVKRVKNADATLNSNYPFVMRRGALSNWTHLINANLQKNAKALGYSAVYTRLLDSGGTVFTDAVLGVTEVLSSNELPKAIYSALESSSGYTLYECKYTLPFGVVSDGEILRYDFTAQDWIENNNALFNCIGGVGTLISSIEKNSYIEGNCAVYIKPHGRCTVFVNGEPLCVPTMGNADNITYPATFNNELLLCGVFENEPLSITTHPSTVPLTIGALNLSALDRLCSDISRTDVSFDKRNIEASFFAEADDVLLVPVAYDSGWGAQSISGFFLGITAESSGENHIKLTYTPPLFIIGLIIFAIAAALMIFWHFLLRKKNTPHFLLFLTPKLFFALWAVAAAVFYIIYPLQIAFGG
ncbi:MAG: YfhO family protein [Clostridia bacterium]|nr:YfhO family protein [Clostridia bacterium]